MREISVETVSDTVKPLVLELTQCIDDDMLAVLLQARDNEPSPLEKWVLDMIL